MDQHVKSSKACYLKEANKLRPNLSKAYHRFSVEHTSSRLADLLSIMKLVDYGQKQLFTQLSGMRRKLEHGPSLDSLSI